MSDIVKKIADDGQAWLDRQLSGSASDRINRTTIPPPPRGTPAPQITWRPGVLAKTIAEAIEAEREGCAAMFDRLPHGMSLTPTEVAAILRARPRP